MESIVWLSDLHRTDAEIAGGKGANLGGGPAAGFVVTTITLTPTPALDDRILADAYTRPVPVLTGIGNWR